MRILKPAPRTLPAPREDLPPGWMLFDPRGRISRRSFWLWGVLALFGLWLLLHALLDIARIPERGAEQAVQLLLVWPSIAISVKRWHDRDRSGWWVLVALVPVVGWLWMLAVNGLLAGTPGPNRFGPRPQR